VTAKGPDGAKFEMKWEKLSIIIVSGKCDLDIDGPGKLVGLLIAFVD
jgi:hypothetical protein